MFSGIVIDIRLELSNHGDFLILYMGRVSSGRQIGLNDWYESSNHSNFSLN